MAPIGHRTYQCSMEAGVLGRQLTCAEQSKVTPLTRMPGRSMRSGRYVMLATALRKPAGLALEQGRKYVRTCPHPAIKGHDALLWLLAQILKGGFSTVTCSHWYFTA